MIGIGWVEFDKKTLKLLSIKYLFKYSGWMFPYDILACLSNIFAQKKSKEIYNPKINT